MVMAVDCDACVFVRDGRCEIGGRECVRNHHYLWSCDSTCSLELLYMHMAVPLGLRRTIRIFVGPIYSLQKEIIE
jgi:hypothetical protein